MSRCTVMPHVSSCLGRRVNTPARDLRPTPRRAQRRRVLLAGRAARTRTTARSSSSGVRGGGDLSRFWVKVAVRGEASVPVSTVCDEEAQLADYMTLPVAQYTLIDMPLGGKLLRLPEKENVFSLTVPRVQIFELVCEPQLVCTVSHAEVLGAPCVRIESRQCLLRGSPFIESLSRCYDFHVVTHFTWSPPTAPSDDGRMRPAVIKSSSDIRVLLDPPMPFTLLPRPVLEQTGNAVMQASLRALQGAFIENLAKDYAKWARDPTYRASRAELSRTESNRA